MLVSVFRRVALPERYLSCTSVNRNPANRKPTRSTCAASAGNRATLTTWDGTRSTTSGVASSKPWTRQQPRPLPRNRPHQPRSVPSALLRCASATRPSPARGPPRPNGTCGTGRPLRSPRTTYLSRRRKVIDHTLYARLHRR
uniref:(northern house mosquito) hypothetical protein n=1 Tax=Culex pipiens TaxID=7175 RepID=A0A8D8FK08_CULPI